MLFLSHFIKGLFIGLGAILPGISSGVICIVVGLYEKLLNSILSFFKDIKGNIKFLFPIVLGIIVGIILFSHTILYLLNIIPFQTKSLFIGLLLGSIHVLAKSNVTQKHNTQKRGIYISFFICFLIGLGLIYLENITNLSIEYSSSRFSALFLILSGFLMSIGIVVPRS